MKASIVVKIEEKSVYIGVEGNISSFEQILKLLKDQFGAENVK